MALRALWLWAKGTQDVRPGKPKSGRIVPFPGEIKTGCTVEDKPKVREPARSSVMSGWRKAAHEKKQRLFGPKTGTVLPKMPEKVTAITPTKPVYHVTCANTGVKVVGGRLWGCGCGKPEAFKFKPGEYATDEQIERRGCYT